MNAEREIFPWDATHKAGDEAAAGQVIQHREFLSDAQWMTVQRQQIARHGELDSFCLGRDISQKNIRRVIETIGATVMFVETDTVESHLFHQLELFDMVFIRSEERRVGK